MLRTKRTDFEISRKIACPVLKFFDGRFVFFRIVKRALLPYYTMLVEQLNISIIIHNNFVTIFVNLQIGLWIMRVSLNFRFWTWYNSALCMPLPQRMFSGRCSHLSDIPTTFQSIAQH